ncbi:MAG: mechanosensitive ion channel family protein [Rubrobacteraceae bacterium]
MNELMATFIQYVPRVLGAVAIIAVGLVLAVIARRGATFLLRRFRFDELCERIGVNRLLGSEDSPRSPTTFVGSLVFYGVLLFSVLAALGPLGLDFLATTLNQVILYAPKAIAAVLILILGTSAAGIIAEMAGRALSGVGVRRVGSIKTFIRFAVIFVVAVLAAAVLEIDVTILIVITVLALGAVALTASLAIGLGLRGLSANVAAGRYVSEGLAVGDEISIEGASGVVEEIGYAMTKVRSPSGKLLLVPNSRFHENIVEKHENVENPPID